MTSPPRWMTSAFAAYDRFTASLAAPLDARARRLRLRLGGVNGGRCFASALTAPAATPFIALLDAYRRDQGIDGDDSRLDAIGEATLALYVYVRIQDDLVDEPERCDRGSVYLAEAFAGRSLGAFAEALGERATVAFLGFREQVMLAFSRVAAWELDVFHAGLAGEGEERRIGEKFLPMALPFGALALLGGRAEHLGALVELVTTLGTGLQVMNDLLNLSDDHEGGRLTPVLRHVYREGTAAPGCSPRKLRAALLAGEALDRAIAWARLEIGQAARLAAATGLPRVAEVIRDREVFLSTVPSLLVAQCLQNDLPGAGPAPEVTR